MRNRLIRFAFVPAAALALAACFTSSSSSSNGTITVRDDSSFKLVELRVAPVDQVSWGPNLLPSELFPGDELTIDVSCDTYDVLVTDEAGRMCTLNNLDLCFSDNVWIIDDQTLATCGF